MFPSIQCKSIEPSRETHTSSDQTLLVSFSHCREHLACISMLPWRPAAASSPDDDFSFPSQQPRLDLLSFFKEEPSDSGGEGVRSLLARLPVSEPRPDQMSLLTLSFFSIFHVPAQSFHFSPTLGTLASTGQLRATGACLPFDWGSN